VCSGIPGFAKQDFDEALYAAFQDLALIETHTPASLPTPTAAAIQHWVVGELAAALLYLSPPGNVMSKPESSAPKKVSSAPMSLGLLTG
jgi:hypothetical protein